MAVRNHVIFLVFIFLFSLFASQKLFNDKFYTTHDGGGHIIRMEEFHESFMDGQIPVRLAKRINHGTSYPFFNFNYPLIYYFGEALHLFGFSFVSVFKVIMFLSILIGAVGMYFFALLHLDRMGAFVSSIFFTIAPYKFLNIYVRGNPAESFALSLIPILFFAIEQVLKKNRWGGIILTSILTLLILSHNITAMIAILLGILYFLFRLKFVKKDKKIILKHFSLYFFFALLLSAFFWVPVIIESPQTKISELTWDYRDSFPSLQELIYSPWGFGAYKQGDFPGKMSPQIGVLHEFMIVFGIGFLLFRKRNRMLLFFLTVSLLAFFLATPASKILWDSFYPLRLVQIPWRFVGYVVLGASFIAGFLVYTIKYRILQIVATAILLILLLYTNRNHVRVNMYIDYESPFLEKDVYDLSTTSKSEHMPKFAPYIYKDPNPDGDIVLPSVGESKRLVWKSNYHAFDVTTYEDALFRDNTSYFPGWRATIDGQETEILHKEDQLVRLLVKVPKGTHRVEFFFGEPWYRLVADIISLSTMIGISFFLILRKRFK